MKKLILVLVGAVLAVSPAFAQAQTVSQMTPDQLRTLLISLMAQVIQLEQQLMALQASQTAPVTHTVTIQSSAAPTQAITITQNDTSTPQAVVSTPPPQNIGAGLGTQTLPAPVVQATPPKPSCTLSVTGSLIGPDGNQLPVGSDPLLTASWTAQGVTLPGEIMRDFGSDGGVEQYQNISDINNASGTMPIGMAWVYKLVFKEATCFAFRPDRLDMTSISTPLDKWSQLTF